MCSPNRGAGAMLACDWPVFQRSAHTMRASKGAQCGWPGCAGAAVPVHACCSDVIVALAKDS
jgi:hypothetical protein